MDKLPGCGLAAEQFDKNTLVSKHLCCTGIQHQFLSKPLPKAMASAALCFIKSQKSVLFFLVYILNQRLTGQFREDRPLVFSTCYPLKQKAM